jgi:hypothetical protein
VPLCGCPTHTSAKYEHGRPSITLSFYVRSVDRLALFGRTDRLGDVNTIIHTTFNSNTFVTFVGDTWISFSSRHCVAVNASGAVLLSPVLFSDHSQILLALKRRLEQNAAQGEGSTAHAWIL